MTRFFAVLAAATIAAGSQAAVQSDPITKVDAVFARWTNATPGCAVGVATGGKTVLQRAYGMSDLEHDVPNAPDSIFEAGSVSKQFTAAAVLFLARDGKLSLDDPVRKYVPELPDYGSPLTIRHMLTHTSGLRDWGSIEAIAGWPRTSRAYTHAHVLDIVSRQKALNFTPGTEWSYSNTGYNLAAVIVSRVSGKPFAEFTAERIFAPLGMTHTSWRDDFTRIVKHRAIAYERAADGYHQDMPFENVHGNGGLLTTVGDLLRWNENFEMPIVGDAAFVKEEQTPGHFTDSRPHEYGLGLFIRPYRGVREVGHSGSTAGYQAYLARYPDQRLSVAVLCNAADASATQYAHAVADAYLGSAATEPAAGVNRPAPPTPFQPSSDDLKAYAGRYASDEAETEFTIVQDAGALVLRQRPAYALSMRPVAKDVFAVPRIGTVTFHRDPSGLVDELHVKQDRVWDLRFPLVRFPQ
jgi:CubicO group peptidase (beta-lactamase class C family)